MQPLPEWVLPPTMPSIYESESFTAMEAVARLYGATKQLIDEYNEFTVALQKEVDEFQSSSSAEITSFKEEVERRLACKFNDIDAKLQAAKLCTEAGIPMFILNGHDPEILYTLLDGGHVGTYFTAKKD